MNMSLFPTKRRKKKAHQGGLTEVSAETVDKRMYETRESDCPVKAVTHFLAKTDPSAKSLFNQCSKDGSKNPDIHSLWYTATPCKVKQFSSFMPDICKNAGVTRYTVHSLRATAITAMSDAGLTDRNIMFMSDHKCEGSLQSYCRRPGTGQKQMISEVFGKYRHWKLYFYFSQYFSLLASKRRQEFTDPTI